MSQEPVLEPILGQFMNKKPVFGDPKKLKICNFLFFMIGTQFWPVHE